MSMKVPLSEFLGMDTWGNGQLCAYVDGMNAELLKSDRLICDLLAIRCPVHMTCADCGRERDGWCECMEGAIVLWEQLVEWEAE